MTLNTFTEMLHTNMWVLDNKDPDAPKKKSNSNECVLAGAA